ncbi:MAG: hypothetical protein H6581_02080 [Bacteroidia bacterium]|nr:hypothetical protein [Bacteroidia bacterium]
MKNGNLFFLLAVTTLFSCSQYDEGPCLSFTSKENRIVGNHWVYEFLVDGVDSTSVIDSVYAGTDYETNGFWFLSQYEQGLVGCYPCGVGAWTPLDDFSRMRLNLPYSYNDTIIYFSLPYFEDWDIVKLTKKDIKLRLEKNGKLYNLNFSTRH